MNVSYPKGTPRLAESDESWQAHARDVAEAEARRADEESRLVQRLYVNPHKAERAEEDHTDYGINSISALRDAQVGGDEGEAKPTAGTLPYRGKK